MEVKDGIEGPTEFVNLLTDREEANEQAKEMIEEYRKTPVEPQSVTEEYEKSLYSGTVMFDDYNSITICVTCKIDSSSKLAGFDPSTIKSNHTDQIWQIKREMKSEIVDPYTNRVMVSHIKEDVDDKIYTDRELANHSAMTSLLAFIKPKTPKINHLEEFDNDGNGPLERRVRRWMRRSPISTLNWRKMSITCSGWLGTWSITGSR